VGEDNVFVFGLDAEGAAALRAGGYHPRARYEAEPELKLALDMIRGGHFSPGDPGRYAALVEDLLARDPYPSTARCASTPSASGARARCRTSSRRGTADGRQASAHRRPRPATRKPHTCGRTGGRVAGGGQDPGLMWEGLRAPTPKPRLPGWKPLPVAACRRQLAAGGTKRDTEGGAGRRSCCGPQAEGCNL